MPFPPMEAQLEERIPVGPGWQYEPKWDGFRCLAFRQGNEVALQSKAGHPLGRYFPEVLESLLALKARQFVLDGELAVPVSDALSFDELLLRLHPAESRVRKLAAAHPAIYIVFDLLMGEKGKSLVGELLGARRQALEAFAEKYFRESERIFLSPVTRDPKQAQRWLSHNGGNLDGVIAKLKDSPYQSGLRTGMQKIKRIRSAECVVGGFRYGSKSKLVGSLLLGLHDEAGLLHHVGFTSSIKAAERAALTRKLERLKKPPGFTGKAPGGPSRWSTERSGEWEPLDPKLVVEVQYDHFTGGRFRHGTKFLRWRPDKAPRQCAMDQVEAEGTGWERLLRRPVGQGKGRA